MKIIHQRSKISDFYGKSPFFGHFEPEIAQVRPEARQAKHSSHATGHIGKQNEEGAKRIFRCQSQCAAEKGTGLGRFGKIDQVCRI